MTDKLRQAAQQALDYIRSTIDCKMGHPPAREAVLDLADALAEPEPRNQCAETCERAKLCAVCAGGLTEQPAEQEPKTQGWQPIETAPKGRVLLVYYKNSLGNGSTMRARHYLPETLESDTTESGWADEGWYEESEAYEYLMPLEHDPTHWMPLPAGPDTAPQPAKRVPLTDAQIDAISDDHRDWTHQIGAFRNFARAIERAHGIGEQE